ncbi:MAG: Glu-tRNA(Gln) amidotransferase subunit GatE [Halobacteriaceae archaeon]
MADFDYEDLGLVAGLEIHQQLDTETKLFCECPTVLREPEESTRRFTRYLHPTKSELGEIDRAALEESKVEREFEYLAYDTTCLVEEDDEPPRRLDEEALEVTLEIAQLLDMTVVDQAQVMRKVVIDGSNTAGFQRSTLIATDGVIETDEGSITIEDLMLEEESAQRVAETATGVRYSLDRLGIPLVEIGTGPDIESPEQARQAAETIGMMLRSTGKVKRGLGTIRQDVNISIEDGARIEIKGVQSLEDIDDLIELEVQRQVRLLDISNELQDRDASVGEIVDVTTVFEGTESSIIQSALNDEGQVLALPLYGFDGLLGQELQPDHRLGTELSNHAIHRGAGGIFHTDELPGYGISEDEIAAIYDEIEHTTDEDAIAIVADSPEVASQAMEAVQERAKAAIHGVPEETRDAKPDGTTEYLRPLPGAARMYPETDVPPVEPDTSEVETPPLLTERADRYAKDLGLDENLAEQVAFSERMPLFEEAIDLGVKPTLAARTIENTYTELRRDNVPVEQLDDEDFLTVFQLLAEEQLTQEGVPDVLEGLAENPNKSAQEIMEEKGLSKVTEEDVQQVVRTVVKENKEQVEEEGMAAFSALMGECMEKLRGKASGDTVSSLLREEIQQYN